MKYKMITFTPSEKKALILTIIVLTAAGLTHIFYPYVYAPCSYNYTKSDSIFSRYSKLQSNIYSPKDVDFKKKMDRFKDDSIGYRQSIKMSGIININTASQKELQKLPGIGPVLALRIMEYRAKYGEFKSINELKKVKGIGNKTLDRMENLIKIK
jgi:comEA protein